MKFKQFFSDPETFSHLKRIHEFLQKELFFILFENWDFPGGPLEKNLPGNVVDMGSIPGPGRSHMPPGS